MKRGYGRASFHASNDVRAGLVTRDEAFENLVPLDQVEPNALEYYTEITGISREEFISTLENQRHPLLKGVPLPIVENPKLHTRPRLFIEDLKAWSEADEL